MADPIEVKSRQCLEQFDLLVKRGWAPGGLEKFNQWLQTEKVLDLSAASLYSALKDSEASLETIITYIQDLTYYLKGLVDSVPPPTPMITRRATLKAGSASEESVKSYRHKSNMSAGQTLGSGRSGKSSKYIAQNADHMRRPEKVIEHKLDRLKQLSDLSRELVRECPGFFKEPHAPAVYKKACDTLHVTFPSAHPNIQKRLVVTSTLIVSSLIEDKESAPLNQDGPPSLVLHSKKRQMSLNDKIEPMISKRTRAESARQSTDDGQLEQLMVTGDGDSHRPSVTLPELDADKRIDGHGLRYICVVPGCKTPYTIYRSKDSWLDHVVNMSIHNKVPIWICTATGHGTAMLPFTSAEAFEDHMREAHADSFTEANLKFLAKSCQRQVQDVFLACTICSERHKSLLPKRDGEPANKPLLPHIMGHFEELWRIYMKWSTEFQLQDDQVYPGRDLGDLETRGNEAESFRGTDKRLRAKTRRGSASTVS